MFTGIVEAVGTVAAIHRGASSARVVVSADLIFDDIHVGDSIAVNGICLTVTDYSDNTFTADVMSETLNRSTELKPESKVNLERALPARGRFGGHIVTGHVDGTGDITRIARDDNALLFTIRTDANVLKYIVEKGSITIDGISLTVVSVSDVDFSVSAIPHTAESTILRHKKVGDMVNLENDIIGKYIEKLVASSKPRSNITEAFLINAGF